MVGNPFNSISLSLSHTQIQTSPSKTLCWKECLPSEKKKHLKRDEQRIIKTRKAKFKFEELKHLFYWWWIVRCSFFGGIKNYSNTSINCGVHWYSLAAPCDWIKIKYSLKLFFLYSWKTKFGIGNMIKKFDKILHNKTVEIRIVFEISQPTV